MFVDDAACFVVFLTEWFYYVPFCSAIYYEATSTACFSCFSLFLCMSYKQKLSSVRDSVVSNKVTYGVGNQGSVPSEATFDYPIWSHFGQLVLSPPHINLNTVCVFFSFMFAPCINSIKALFIIPTDAHNYKIIGILKTIKFR